MEERYSVRVPTDCSVVFAGEVLIGEGRIIDVSLPGCLMESLDSPKPGDYIQLKLFLPDQQPAIRVFLAVVRWTEGNRSGVEFIRSSEADQTRLTRFVQRRRRRVPALKWEEGIEILSVAGE